MSDVSDLPQTQAPAAKPTLRVLLLLRYGATDGEALAAHVKPHFDRLLPDWDAHVVDSGTAFRAAQPHIGSRFDAWIRYATSEVTAAGPTFHAFAVLDSVVGHATGQIVRDGAVHKRPTLYVNLAANLAGTVASVEAMPGGKLHDWKLL